MKLGFAPATGMMLDFEHAFKLAEELELDFIELAYDLHEIEPSLQAPDRIRALKQATGLSVTIHLAYVDFNLASLVPAARETAVERTLRGIEYAVEVGATCGVLHSGRHYLRHPVVDPYVEGALESSLARLQGLDFAIALENLALGDDDLLQGPEALKEVTERHQLINCLDFGHANVEASRATLRGEPAGDLCARYLQVLNGSIRHLHLHNNDGTGDQHRPTNLGTIKFDAYRDYLKAFTGTACLELVGGEQAIRASVAHLRALLDTDRWEH